MGELLAQPPESGLSGGEVRSEDDTDEFDDTGDAKDEEDIEGSGEKQFCSLTQFFPVSCLQSMTIDKKVFLQLCNQCSSWSCLTVV